MLIKTFTTSMLIVFSLCFSSLSYATDTVSEPNDGYTATKYPIVLAHGLVGFDSMFFGLINYWPGISQTLTADGAKVYITQTSALNSSQVRGEQLLQQVKEIIAISGAAKVNLIGHSQGALDIRYVAAVRPDLVASITSVGGPNGSGLGGVFDASNNRFGGLLTLTANFVHLFSLNFQPIDANAAFYDFTAAGHAAFTAAYPVGLPAEACGEGAAIATVDGNDIRIYSWGGTALWTTFIDPSDPLLAFIGLAYPSSTQHDGVVARCDSHLGDVIRDDYGLNHFDLINQIMGLVPVAHESPKSIFRTHANRLKNAGL